MGRTARWFRGLLGGGKKSPAEESVESSEAQPAREKKRWGFGKSFREKMGPPQQTAASEERRGAYGSALLTKPPMARAYGAGVAATMDDVEEQNRRAISVAAATAAVAEAAVVAAQAAAAVVRLTSSRRIAGGFGGAVAAVCAEYGKREERTAVKIQSAFRGYLSVTFGDVQGDVSHPYEKARRALRALRGLVKLQALVRGNIVRKQAAEALRSMQALVRVQARARACRALEPQKRMSERAHGSHARNSCRTPGADRTNSAKFVGQNFLEGWMEEKCYDSRAISRRTGIRTSADDDRSAKILEVDFGMPQYTNRRWNNCSPCSSLTSDQNSRSFATMPDSLSKDSITVHQSIPSPSSVDMQQSMTTPGFPFVARDYEESPQFYSTSSRPGSSRKGPFTPTKSEGSRSMSSELSGYPNYMSNTQSSKAKLRSQSAPKQRPDFENPSCIKKSAAHALNPFGSKSSSMHAKFANKAYPGSGRLDRLGMPIKC